MRVLRAVICPLSKRRLADKGSRFVVGSIFGGLAFTQRRSVEKSRIPIVLNKRRTNGAPGARNGLGCWIDKMRNPQRRVRILHQVPHVRFASKSQIAISARKSCIKRQASGLQCIKRGDAPCTKESYSS
jgi:hypothetical protein